MLSIRKMFNSEARLIFKERGFKQKGNIYYRVVNDVVQHFDFVIYSTYNCDVNYSVTPLAAGLEYLPGGRLSLAKTTIETYGEWKYSTISDESKKTCIEDIVKHIKLYLVPFFDGAVDCMLALEATIQAEKLQYKNYCSYVKNNFLIKPPISPLNEINMCDHYKLWMALKCKDWSAVDSLYHYIIGHEVMAYVSVKSWMDSKGLDKRYKNIEELVHDAASLGLSHDTKEIDMKIAENEKLSLKTLAG